MGRGEVLLSDESSFSLSVYGEKLALHSSWEPGLWGLGALGEDGLLFSLAGPHYSRPVDTAPLNTCCLGKAGVAAREVWMGVGS